MQNQEIQVNQDKSLEIASKRNLIVALERGNKAEINASLRVHKTETGLINYKSVLSIPRSERICELVKTDPVKIPMLITVALTLAFESLNLKRGMSAAQVVDLAEMIVDEAGQDYLSMEDLLLFLQKLVRGEYGTNYESMDCAKFMDKFEVYREARYQALKEHQREQHVQHKVMGDTGRETQKDELSEHFSSFGERLSGMKYEISKLKEENKNLKINNF